MEYSASKVNSDDIMGLNPSKREASNLLDELFRYLKENGLSPSPVENVGTKNVVNINGKNVYIQNCKSTYWWAFQCSVINKIKPCILIIQAKSIEDKDNHFYIGEINVEGDIDATRIILSENEGNLNQTPNLGIDFKIYIKGDLIRGLEENAKN